MTRMRHPAPDVTGEIDVPEGAVGMHRMTGWLTDDEWERAGLPEPEPEPEDEPSNDSDEESDDDEPEDSGEQKPKRSRRPRSRVASEEKDEG